MFLIKIIASFNFCCFYLSDILQSYRKHGKIKNGMKNALKMRYTVGSS